MDPGGLRPQPVLSAVRCGARTRAAHRKQAPRDLPGVALARQVALDRLAQAGARSDLRRRCNSWSTTLSAPGPGADFRSLERKRRLVAGAVGIREIQVCTVSSGPERSPDATSVAQADVGRRSVINAGLAKVGGRL